MTRTSLIGAPLPRHDALGKVTGATPYPGDLVRPGMLRLKVVFAGRPHARILGIDGAEALAHPGVVAVLTAADVPSNAFGLIDADQPVLCGDVVRFTGDKVALVVAETDAAAEAGAALVRVRYEDLPAVTDTRAALRPDAPLVHPERGTNLLLRVPIRKGDVARGFAEADVVLDGEFSTSWQEHAFLQPEAGIAFIDEQQRVVVETAGQWLHEDRRQIAAMLRLPEERVVVRYGAIGGAFGGREDLSIQHLLALAAWTLRRPVAMVWSREESIVGHHKRHPMRIRCRWGARRDGRITAVEAETIADGGAYASTSVEVTKVAALFASGAYEVPNVSSVGYAVYTNNVPSGAFRGFGAPQSQFAAESMVTRLAHALGIDPVEFRRRNLYREGSIEPTQHPLPPGVSAVPVLERCVEEARTRFGGWGPGSGRSTSSLGLTPHPVSMGGNGNAVPTALGPPPSPSHLRRGVGIASGIKNLGYSFGFPEQATATVELYGRGEPERAVLRVGAADVGQGSHLAMRQIAAEELGLAPELIELVCDDSAEAPNAGSASASRLTLMAGRAVGDAAADALARYRDSDDQRVEATVQYRPPVTTPLAVGTGAGVPNYCYGYAAQAVEAEVNLLTGQVRIISVISVHDVGKAINRQQVEGQIEGCLAQAIGYALMEDFRVEKGRVLTPYLSTYLLPTALDVPPEIVPVVLELADPNGPFGARGVAEMPLVPFLPAVAAAIHDAVGVWLSDQPFTPERVLNAMAGQAAGTVGSGRQQVVSAPRINVPSGTVP
ncbi:MAG: xanthine dehydrogenase family protein molybdopterin-binding subunit [Chloroflexota bacterium]|nr:xanthine dehydrogenase family protein molybdopterin-binding subunit [Chloroflexota bacterium]